MAETQELATGETPEPEELTPEETEQSQESSTEEEGPEEEDTEDDESEEEESEEEEEEETEQEPNDRASEHPAVCHCINAWNRALNKAEAEGEDNCEARLRARAAYLRSMPPLAGFENVRDYIACVSFAQVAEVIVSFQAESLLAT